MKIIALKRRDECGICKVSQSYVKKLEAIAAAAKKVWDSDEFFESEDANGDYFRTDEVDPECLLTLGDLLDDLEKTNDPQA